MPLVHVHGVATRPTDEYRASVRQRDALYRTLIFKNKAASVHNPDWGSHAIDFSTDLPWLPKPSGNERFAAGEEQVAFSAGLGQLVTQDAQQAIDLAVMAALEQQIRRAVKVKAPDLAADQETIDLADAAASFMSQAGLLSEQPKGLDTLRSDSDAAFADTLSGQLETEGDQPFGVGDKLKDAVRSIGNLLGNGASDLALRAVRQSLSRGISLFLGDVFVYLGKRDVAGKQGTRERIFEPIIVDLVEAAKESNASGEPLVVVGHSLGV